MSNVPNIWHIQAPLLMLLKKANAKFFDTQLQCAIISSNAL